MVAVTKLRWQFIDPKTKVPTTSSEFSKVYFHFNGTCISRYNSCFVPQLVEVAEKLKSLFSDVHKTFLHALGICLWFDVYSWNELLSITDYYRLRLCGSLWLSLLNCVMLILELKWVKPHNSFGLCRIFSILFSQNWSNLQFRIFP